MANYSRKILYLSNNKTMSVSLETKFMQLLCSKVCHDIIGPITSAHFGIEILLDVDSDSTPEAEKLTLSSMHELLGKINFFRSALGYGSMGEGISAVTRSRKLVFDLYRSKEIIITWQSQYNDLLTTIANNNNIKVLLNMFFIMFQHTPVHSKVLMQCAKLPNNKLGVGLSVKGVKRAHIHKSILNVASMSTNELTEDSINVHNIALVFLKRLSENSNSVCNIQFDENDMRIANIFNIENN